MVELIEAALWRLVFGCVILATGLMAYALVSENFLKHETVYPFYFVGAYGAYKALVAICLLISIWIDPLNVSVLKQCCKDVL